MRNSFTKKALSLLLAVCMAFGMCAVTGAEEVEETASPLPAYGEGYTVILHSNDVHGAIEGYTYIAGIEKALEAQGADVILADAGDYSQGTTYVSLSKGANAVTMMNAVGYDVATLGNHEFDYGYPQLAENMSAAEFDVLCADVLEDLYDMGDVNFDGKVAAVDALLVLRDVVDLEKLDDDAAAAADMDGDGKVTAGDALEILKTVVKLVDVVTVTDTIFDANTIIETESGVKVGFFGLETPETQTKANPALIQGLTFLTDELYACAQDQVDELKEAGADVIVCLAHLGVDEESEPYTSYDLYRNTEGIDFIIDGHSHTVMTSYIATEEVVAEDAGSTGELMGTTTVEYPIQSTGTKFAYVGYVVIDNATKEIIGNDLLKVADGTPTDEAVAAAAKEIIDPIDKEYGQTFAKTAVDLIMTDAEGKNIVRTRETNLGDLVTDAMLWKIVEDENTALEVDAANVVSVTNGGGIRANIAAGDVTKNDIYTVLPFGNTLAVVYVTGAELLEALEASTYCTPSVVGGFPQVSGIEYTIDTTKEYDANEETYPGSTYYGPASINRVTITSINGNAFDPEATYAVVTNNFVAAGGDTYYAFASATSQFDTGYDMAEVVIEYINEKLEGTITEEAYGTTAGRITVKTAEAAE